MYKYLVVFLKVCVLVCVGWIVCCVHLSRSQGTCVGGAAQSEWIIH